MAGIASPALGTTSGGGGGGGSTNITQWGSVNVSIGQQASSASIPVVLASDETVPVNITQVSGATLALGQASMANSIPVVISSDQSKYGVLIVDGTGANIDLVISGNAIPGGGHGILAMGSDYAGHSYSPLVNTDGSQWFMIRDSAGNNRGANVNSSNQLSVSIDNITANANLVSGIATATGTSDTQVIGAQGANQFIYIQSISVVNTGSTTSLVTIETDTGSAKTAIWYMINPAGGGDNITFPVPLKVPVANKNLGFVSGSASTTQYVSISGYFGL